jgi:hypothetical protein
MRTSPQIVLIACGFILASVSPAFPAGITLRSCIGVRQPPPPSTLPAFDCTQNEVSGNLEVGTYLFLDYTRGNAVLESVVIDMSKSSNGMVGALSLITPNHQNVTDQRTINTLANTLSFTFQGFNSGVHFWVDDSGFSRRGGGIPLASDLAGAVITARFADGTVLTGTYQPTDQFDVMVTLNSVPATLTVNKVVVPGNDPGKFDLLVDGMVRLAGARGNDTTGPILLQPGTHTVSESASAGTVGSEYSSRFQGACGPNGMITLSPGDNKICTVINFHGSGALLTVRKTLAPRDVGRFDISVDGAVLLPSAGNGNTTGEIPLPPGTHSVTEQADANTDGSAYVPSFQGDCAPRGTVNLARGDNKTCTIVNRHRSPSSCSPGLHWCGFDEGCQRFCF